MADNVADSEPSAVLPPFTEEEMLSWVKVVARVVHSKLPSFVDYDDLCQVGYFGLRNAISKYNADRVSTFKTYARNKILWAIYDYLRKQDWVSRDFRGKLKALEAQLELEGRLGLEDNESETSRLIADLTHQKSLDLQQALGASVMTVHRLVRKGRDGEDREIEPADHTRPSPEQILLLAERDRLIWQIVDGLPDREKAVLRLYIENDFSMLEIAGLLGISESRASQLYKIALGRLRPCFYAYSIATF